MSNGHVCCILGVCCPPPGARAKQIEALAEILHEAGREAVTGGATVAAEKFGEQTRTFIEWNDLSDMAQEGHRIQARFLLKLFDFVPKGVGDKIVEAYRSEFAKAFGTDE